MKNIHDCPKCGNSTRTKNVAGQLFFDGVFNKLEYRAPQTIVTASTEWSPGHHILSKPTTNRTNLVTTSKPDSLLVTCGRCGYKWESECMDAETK